MNRRTFIIAFSLLIVSSIMLFSLFRSRSATGVEQFRTRVLKVARSTFPGIRFEPSEGSSNVIVAKGIQIGLQNLEAKFDQSDRTQQTLEQLVTEHFRFVLQERPAVPDFDAAKSKLRPQLMPPEYAKQAPIISFPFGQTLAIGIVLDSEEGYQYLKREDALQWKKSEKELLDLAIANLDAASRGIEMQSSDNVEAKWIGIETKDGFDAVRILIPRLREFLIGRLGSPFRFAVPNRDFLVCWNTGASARFADFTAAKIEKDFKTQPYSLSPHVFEISADGTISEGM